MWPFKQKIIAAPVKPDVKLPVSFVACVYLGLEMRGNHPTHVWVVSWENKSGRWTTQYAKHGGLKMEPPSAEDMAKTFEALAATM